MKLSAKATMGHLVAGALLILLSLACMVTGLFIPSKILTFLVFFLVSGVAWRRGATWNSSCKGNRMNNWRG
jgi:hypothetical protein